MQHSGTARLAANPYEQCSNGAGFWYERTNVRKIPYSSCEGGTRPDRGARHPCPLSTRGHGFLWWTTVILSPFALAALVGFWWMKRSVGARGSYGLVVRSLRVRSVCQTMKHADMSSLLTPRRYSQIDPAARSRDIFGVTHTADACICTMGRRWPDKYRVGVGYAPNGKTALVLEACAENSCFPSRLQRTSTG